MKYKGIRDVGYSVAMDPNHMLGDLVKFGKRVQIGEKPTNEQIMEAHLNQMRHNVENTRLQKEMKQKNDLEFLEHIKSLDYVD